jgi:Fis family transcriptional regulator
MGAHATQRAAEASAANGKIRTRDGDSLEQSVLRALEQYFADLDGAKPHALHGMVMHAVERPLLQFAMRRTNGNQSAAAELLGINRNTLRKKLTEYRLD